MAPRKLFTSPRPTKKRRTTKARPARPVSTLAMTPQLKWTMGRSGSYTPSASQAFGMIKDHAFAGSSLFTIARGANTNQRVGNIVTGRQIQVKYDLPYIASDSAEVNIWLVRDTEAQAATPTTLTAWEAALFDDTMASISSQWSNNFRNPDHTNRFQIVKALNIHLKDHKVGLGQTLNGYFNVKMNTPFKYPTLDDVDNQPTNVRYYLLFHMSSAGQADISPNIMVKSSYVDN